MAYKITGKLLKDYQRKIIQQFHNGSYKHMLLIMPRRSGKSFLSLYNTNLLTNQYWNNTKMPINSIILAPEQKQCREIYIDNILDDGRHLVNITNARYLKSNLTLEYSFGSKIKFSGSDNIDNRMGGGYKIIGLDEFSISKPEVFQLMYPMIHNTKGNMIIPSTTRGRNHLYDLYLDVKNNPDWLVIKTDVFELGIMTEAEYDALPMEENYKAQEYLCSWDSPFLNAIYSAPLTTTEGYIRGLKVYGSIDLGIKDATSILLAQQLNKDIITTSKIRKQVNIIKSMEFTNTSLTDRIQAIKDYLITIDYPLKDFVLFTPHDAEIRNDDLISRRKQIEDMGIKCQPVKRNSILGDIERLREIWHTIYWYEKDTFKAIEHIKAYTTNQTTQMPKHDEHSHTADSLSYMMIGIDKINKQHTIMPTSYQQYNRSL